MKPKMYYIDTNYTSQAQGPFKTLKKAREIARYLVTSPRKDIRITATGGEKGSGEWTEGYVGMTKDYKNFYFENASYSNTQLGYCSRYVLKKDGSLGAEIPRYRGDSLGKKGW